ncbi:leucine-rich repeat receptor-like serine/threonine-protein kinase SKM1 [Ricinus communis]|uniref:leucine-rich repeat receptor-like serine/threonine-protein kinase SKM1 n=1 Tax=Ricinus communis TaxID=3988 RepID=UPI00201A8D6C|nr:leucine-rich repeat receptor-like serine/threonine-protein kinase SKM1 [Ricinus communis]
METESQLVRLCIEAACESRESIDKWRRQRRTLERLPSPLADILLRRLLHRRLLFPSLLEVFKQSVEVVDLRGENAVDAEWMAYLGAFRYLRYLNLADCNKITSSALWSLTGMTSLKELDLSRSVKVTDAGIRHLLSISSLEILRIPETGLTAKGVALLTSLTNLSVLDLGGLPVTDMALSSLQVLTKLEYLDLWGSNISNNGVAVLQLFPKLSFLNLGWTSVTRLPSMLSLEYLNLSNCTIESLLEGDGDKAPLTKVILSGATFPNEAEAFYNIEPRFLSFLDVSNSSLQGFYFLHDMKMLEHLDLSSTMMGDDAIEAVACIGANLTNLNLSKTRVTSAGLAILAEHVPKLEYLSLSHALVDDFALSYIGMMSSLKVVDLSNTNIKGFIRQMGVETNLIPSLKALQGLSGLQSLNLEHTQVRDAAVAPVSSFQELSHLSLKSASLADETLYHLSSLSKLTSLVIGDAVLTNCGLDLFRPPVALKMLDLRGCWLLTEEAISSFCTKHPAIKLRHELLNVSSPNESSSYRASPSRILSRPPHVSRKQGKMPVSWPMPQHFIDQRLKYSREELLALQYQSSHERGIAMPKMPNSWDRN